jgi:hypothetical protein
MNQNIIDKVGSYNLENPVAEVVDNRFFKKPASYSHMFLPFQTK